MAAGRTKRVAPQQLPLYTLVDHGPPGTVTPNAFVKKGDAEWGAFGDSFLRFNEAALRALDVQAEPQTGAKGLAIRLTPGGRAGAVPLRSAQTGRVVGGLLVKPRFGWSGVGRVLAETGWPALPEFLALPMVPGSGREVPPWVLAGPVLARLEAMLSRSRRGYREREAVLGSPRGRILWDRYVTESLARGHWERLPCRFPDLEHDPLLQRYLRWVLERLHRDLVRVGRTDPIAVRLADLAARLLELLVEQTGLRPRRTELERWGRTGMLDEPLRLGLEAMAWVEEERGMGGGRELDGLAWTLSLERLWEAYVEGVIRREARLTGGEVKVGRLRETTIPISWSDPAHRSLGHLEPDIVVRRGRSVHVVDAKYKAHLAELDDLGWRRFTDEVRAAHRADIHQVLAYAGLFDADEITATLVYPLRRQTWADLQAHGRDRVSAELIHGGRRILLTLRGLPFGWYPSTPE
ncbi:MAG: 5-methylcytosine restriction system specificity protein McrC [Bacillota bacterium]